ncbi:MAG: AAA family ATPase [Caulobacteraceae bacterium]|nr:AAA family ATPase [Caulobacteraceae bacterium]
MRSIAVIGRKGGSGKTTVAVHLAIGLHLRGRRTILADADPQRSSIEVLRGREGGGPEPVASSGPKLFALKTASMRAGLDALVIDTPAVLEDEVAHAVVLSDVALLVVRPTFLDLAAAVRTSDIIRRLRKPGLVVLNQAPIARGQVEPPLVKRSVEALKLLRLPLAPVIIRSRAAYQSVLETGRSAEELDGESMAAQEMRELCAFVDRFVFGGRAPSRSEV